MRRLLFLLALLILPVSAEAQSPIISGNLTSATCPGSGCLTLSVNGMGSASIQLAGTFSGTVQFETTVDGSTYSALLMTKATDASTATSSTGVGVWSAWVGGSSIVRARVSSYSSGTVRATIGGALGLAAPGLSGVILGNGVQPATAVPLPADATKFFDGVGAWAVPAGTGAGANATFLTATDETGTLANSRQLIAGSNITFDTTTPGQLSIAASGGGNPFDQDLNTTDSPTFDVLTVTSCTGCGGGGVVAPLVLTTTVDTGTNYLNPASGDGGGGWTQAPAATWTHNAGNLTPLVYTETTPIGAGEAYQFTITQSAGTSGTANVYQDGVLITTLYGVSGALDTSAFFTAAGDDTVQIVPTTDYDGTLSAPTLYHVSSFIAGTDAAGNPFTINGLGVISSNLTATSVTVASDGVSSTTLSGTSVHSSNPLSDANLTAALDGSVSLYLSAYGAGQEPYINLYNIDQNITAKIAFNILGALEFEDALSYTFDQPVSSTGFQVTGLTTPTNKPVCFDASGNLYAGTNTGGVLSCP